MRIILALTDDDDDATVYESDESNTRTHHRLKIKARAGALHLSADPFDEIFLSNCNSCVRKRPTLVFFAFRKLGQVASVCLTLGSPVRVRLSGI